MLVIAAALLLDAMSAIYTARHFAIDTDINNLISERLPWRLYETAFQEAFPAGGRIHSRRRRGGASPEAAKAAAREASQALAKWPDLFRMCGISSTVRFFRSQRSFCFFRRIRWRISPNRAAQKRTAAHIRLGAWIRACVA